jgi:hypothetical protein
VSMCTLWLEIFSGRSVLGSARLINCGCEGDVSSVEAECAITALPTVGLIGFG